MVTDHQHHVSDSNPKRSVINASNTVTEMSNNLVTIVETKMKGKLLVTTKSNWQHVLKVLNGKARNAGDRAVKESNLSRKKRRLLSCQAAEMGNSIGYTAEGIPGISNISLKGKF